MMNEDIKNIIYYISVIAFIILAYVGMFVLLPRCFPCLECHEKNLMCYCPDGKFPQENQPYCENKSNIITPDFRGDALTCEKEMKTVQHDYGKWGGIQNITCYRCKEFGGDWYCPV